MIYTRGKNYTKQQIPVSAEVTQGQCVTNVKPIKIYEVEITLPTLEKGVN
jgi:hypothetical protein